MSPLILGKVASVERAVTRARSEHAAAGDNFAQDFTRQDAAMMNILRACETSLDLANILIRTHALGIPQSSRHSFQLLAEAGLIGEDLSQALQRMIGFRNVAVHQYQTLDIAIVETVLAQGLDELLVFAQTVVKAVR